MIGIRVDGNGKIGTGHVMRCLSIARELKKLDVPFLFIFADEQAQTLMEPWGYDTVILHTAYDDMMSELPELKKVLTQQKVQLMLLDTYQAGTDYFKALEPFVKIAYMDDMFEHTKDAPIIINYNIYGTKMEYQPGKHWLLGTIYAPLREEFQNVVYEPQKKVKHIFVSTGGSDQFSLASSIVEYLELRTMAKDLTFHVVSGKLNSNYASLQQLALKYGNVEIHHNVEKMSELMKQCDLAISAAGSTMYELCAVGIPTICFSYAENHDLVIRYFIQDEYAFYGGSFELGRNMLLEQMDITFWQAIRDEKTRMQMSRRCKELVDGHGAERLAMALHEYRNDIQNNQF